LEKQIKTATKRATICSSSFSRPSARQDQTNRGASHVIRVPVLRTGSCVRYAKWTTPAYRQLQVACARRTETARYPVRVRVEGTPAFAFGRVGKERCQVRKSTCPIFDRVFLRRAASTEYSRVRLHFYFCQALLESNAVGHYLCSPASCLSWHLL
jgi:hypothetical protein